MDIRDEMLKNLSYWKEITEKNIIELQSRNEDLDIKIDEIEIIISDSNQLEDDRKHFELINQQNDVYFKIQHLKGRLTKINELINFENDKLS